MPSAHLRALKVEEDVTRIQDAVTAYGRSTGNLPAAIHTLIAAGLLRGFRSIQTASRTNSRGDALNLPTPMTFLL